MVSVQPTLNGLPDTSFVETNVNPFGGVLSTNTLADAMSDNYVFDGCFDECGPLGLPQSLVLGNSVLQEVYDFACTASGETHYQTANSRIGSADQPW